MRDREQGHPNKIHTTERFTKEWQTAFIDECRNIVDVIKKEAGKDEDNFGDFFETCLEDVANITIPTSYENAKRILQETQEIKNAITTYRGKKINERINEQRTAFIKKIGEIETLTEKELLFWIAKEIETNTNPERKKLLRREQQMYQEKQEKKGDNKITSFVLKTNTVPPLQEDATRKIIGTEIGEIDEITNEETPKIAAIAISDRYREKRESPVFHDLKDEKATGSPKNAAEKNPPIFNMPYAQMSEITDADEGVQEPREEIDPEELSDENIEQTPSMPEIMRRGLYGAQIAPEQDAPPASATSDDWHERHWIDSENTPTRYKKAQENTPSIPPPQKTSFMEKMRHRALVGIAAIASIFGVKMGLEKTGEALESAASMSIALTGQDMHEGLHQGTYMVEALQPKDTAPTQELTTTYTIQKGDTLWGIANAMVAESGLADPEGLLALKAVKSLREENGIEGNAATSKKMWTGATLTTSETAHLLAGIGKTELPKTARVTTTEKSPQEHGTLTAASAPEHPETLASAVPAELLSTTLAPGETVFSRTFHMLESVGLSNPNIAKRSVLSAIVLADSHMSEAQAMRIKPAGHKKFDPAKDTLDFSRAALAAADLKAGMSPAEVAKKYGVTNVYSKLRAR